ncbi:MAG TPA: MFS transporter [Solirubrobacteraceae bacterium]|nr:MFS transporter [Solirubrobacteraceae bacterium]
MASSETRRLLARPGFTRYFLTVAAARATGTMFNVAGVLLILERTHDLALAGVVVAAATLPAAFTGPFLGGWLDVAASRRRLLVLDRIVTAAALGAILLLAGHAPNWLLPVTALVFGATSPLSSGAFSAVLPEVAGPDLLEAANAFEGASINAAFIVGPALAGLIAAGAGAAAAIEVQIGAGLAIAVAIVLDETFELRPQHDEAPLEGVMHAVREGLAATWRIQPLRWNMTIDGFYVLAWSTLNVSLPAFAIAIGAGAHAAGYMWASVAAGSMLGGFALRRRSADTQPRLFIGGYFLAMAATAALWPLAGSLPVALALVFLTGVLDGPGLVALISIRQRLAPPQLRAQIFTTASSFHAAVLAAGAAGAGLFHSAFGTDATLLVFAVLIAAAAGLALVSQYEAPGGE